MIEERVLLQLPCTKKSILQIMYLLKLPTKAINKAINKAIKICIIAVLVLSFASTILVFNAVFSIKVKAQVMSLQISNRMPGNVEKLTQEWLTLINASPRKLGVRLQSTKTSQLAGLLQKVVRGEIDGAWVRINDSPGRMQWSHLFSAPGLKGSSALLSAVMWRLHKSFFIDLQDYNQLQVMAFLVMPPDSLRFTKRVAGLTKFNNSKLRCIIPECSNFLDQLGIRTFSLIDEKVPLAIKNESVIGMFLPSLQENTIADVFKQYNSLVPYALSSKILWQRQVYALVISSITWAKLSRNVQKFMQDNSGENLSESFGASIDISHHNYIKESYPFLSERKVEWSIDDLIRLKKESDKYREKIVKEAAPRIKGKLRNVIKILKEIE